jgi:hypothetical protein
MDIFSSNWVEADSSNSTAPPDGAPEGMAPGGTNDVLRAHQGAIKRFWNKINAVKTTAGTTSSFTLTYDVAPAAYVDGEIISFVVNATNAAAATINVNALGAKPLRKFTGSAFANLAAGDLQANQIVQARYSSSAGAFDIIAASGGFTLAQNLAASGYQYLPGGLVMQWGTTAVGGNGSTASPGYSVALSAAAYSILLTNTQSRDRQVYVSASTTTGFTFANPASDGSTTVYWLSIGPA